MRNLFILIFALTLSGCVSQANDQTVKDLVAKIDSVSQIAAHERLTIDSLTNALHYQKTMAKRTAGKCHDYAVIVKKNPTQSVFIVNWIDRAFDYTKTK